MGNGVTTRKHLPLYPWLLSKMGDSLNPFNGRVLCFAEPLEMKTWILCINSEKGKWLWIIEWEERGFLKNSLRGREWGKTELKETSKLQKPCVLPSRLSEVHPQRKKKTTWRLTNTQWDWMQPKAEYIIRDGTQLWFAEAGQKELRPRRENLMEIWSPDINLEKGSWTSRGHFVGIYVKTNFLVSGGKLFSVFPLSRLIGKFR